MNSMRTEPDLRYSDLFRHVRFDPVFIIGDHRSGTTVLYTLLARTGAFNVVTAYHVIRYGEIVANHVSDRTAHANQELADRFAALGLGTRLIDGVRVTPDLPEEYGFIIDRSSRPRLRPETLSTFIELCQKIRYTGTDRPVLLKNPWDVLGFAYLHDVFPRARFVFVHRHPLRVMSSQLAAMRSLFSERNEYVAMLSEWYRRLFANPAALRLTKAGCSARLGIGPRLVGRHVAKVACYYGENIVALPRQSYLEVRYEDLCEQPDATLQHILAFLDLKARCELDAARIVQPRRGAVLPEVAARYPRIRHALGDYLAAQAYDMDS